MRAKFLLCGDLFLRAPCSLHDWGGLRVLELDLTCTTVPTIGTMYELRLINS
jgi:hypothetical protein